MSHRDTIKARCGDAGAYELVKVRIAAIDAPDEVQPYGQRSKEALSRDGAMMVGGWAKVYERCAEVGDTPLFNAQDDAQNPQKGLWRDPKPVAPW